MSALRTSLLLLLLAPALHAQNLGGAVHIGTTGPGLDIAYRLSRPVTVRLGGRYLSLKRSYDTTVEDLDLSLTGDVRMASGAALLDVHPFHNAFRLTLGAVYNQNRVKLSGTPTGSYTSGSTSLTADEIGTLAATLAFPKLNGYGGIGLGQIAGGRRLGLLLDLGVLYQGPPTFSMEATGALAPTADQDAQIERDMASYKLYPVLNLGLGVRF